MIIPESAFLGTDERCQSPQHWLSGADGDTSEWPVSRFFYALTVLLQPEFVVETGAAFGQTTAQIAAALAENGHGHLVALDVDPARVKSASLAVRAWGDYAEVQEVSSLDYTPTQPINLLFSDSLYELRVPEIRRLQPWLAPYATVAIHDTAPDRGRHRIANERSLREEIEDHLVVPGWMKAIDFPTPRGLTLCEYLGAR